MSGWFVLTVAVVLVQRLAEWAWSLRNSRLLRSWGAVEVGREHFPLIVGMHGLFFLSWIGETVLFRYESPVWWPIPLLVLLAAQVLRIWVLRSLGPFWNVRIWVVPRMRPVVKGPYRFLRHPNYVVVMMELLSLPLLFGAYGTAILFSVLNWWILTRVRIPVEEQAWADLTDYEKVMAKHHRFIPGWTGPTGRPRA
jgi:methyltransferase